MDTESKAQATYNMDELFSTNAYGVVELVDGTKVKCQFTMRYGLSAEKALAQLDEWRAFLEGATSRGVKLEGPNVAPMPDVQNAPSGTPVADSKEPVYENVDGSKPYTVAAVFRDQNKDKTKDILKVVTVEPPHNGKYGVSCFRPGPEFGDWKSWPLGTRYSPPAGAGHVLIRPPADGGKYFDITGFLP